MEELERNLDFMDAGIDLSALADVNPVGRTAVLERLGPAHFRSKGFSFMGFLQTVYDHVAQTALEAAPVTVEPTATVDEPAAPDTAPAPASDEVDADLAPFDDALEVETNAGDELTDRDAGIESEFSGFSDDAGAGEVDSATERDDSPE